MEGSDRFRNFMARNLTGQVRNIAQSRRLSPRETVEEITVDVKGEILELKTH